jgi:iron-sulfur cluster assembly accessory protein
MLQVTPAAATQIRTAAVQGNAIGLPLRIAIQTKADGRFHYLMGFDDQNQTGDQTLTIDQVVVVVDARSQPLVQGMTIDFVELDGQWEFIFLNPNDPHYQAPQV